MADVLSTADRRKTINTLSQELADLNRRLLLRDTAGARVRIGSLRSGLAQLDALLDATQTAQEVTR